MKSLRIMLASAALILIGLSSCQEKEVFTGEDSSKPGVTELAYDEINSSDDVIAFTYNNDAALKQGATSFTVQLLKKTDGSDGDNYDPALTAVVMAEDTPNSGAIIAGKKKGQKYLVRARANYAKSVYSPWTWLMDGADTAVVKVGTGVVKEDLDILTAASAQLVYATSKALNVQFSATAFIDVNTDITYSYDLYLYKDAACSNLVVSYTVTPACFGTSAEKKTVEPAFIFTCLEPATDYYLVTEYTDAVKGKMRCDAPQKFSTLPNTNVLMNSRAAGSAQPGDVILQEDFSDLAWGGDYIESATGISSADRASLPSFYTPTGDHVSSAQLEYFASAPAKGSLPETEGFYFCPYSTEMGLFNTIGTASLSSESIAQFYQIAENGSTWGTICAKPGYLKLGASSYMGMIVTPKMTALSGPAKVKVSFRACPYGGSSLDPTRAAVVVFEGLKANENHYVTGSLDSQGGAYTEFDLAAKYQWADYSFEISNVLPDSQIGIGNVRRDGSAPGGKQMRMFIDDIKIEVLEYGSISLEAPVATATATDKAITVTWEPVAMATGYVVEYKKAADAEWTVLDKTENTTVTISDLPFETAFQVRVKAVRDDISSEYGMVEISTLPEAKIATEVATGAEFVEWLKKANVTADGEYKITADLDMAGLTVPTVEEFPGTLDGQGHTIKNLTASAPLFQKLTGTVKNLTIEGNVSVTLAEETAEGHPLAVLANISKGTIENVTNKANVTMSSSGILGSPVVAGIVAYQEGGALKNLSNFGKVSLTHAGSANAAIPGFNRKPFVAVGGIVGVLVKSSIENSQNEGVISVVGTNPAQVSARHYVGGLVGTPEGAVVKGCVNKGAVSADFTDPAKSAAKQVWVGGIIGGRNGDGKDFDGAQVENCDNYGECTLIAENSVNNYLAGIAGQSNVEATSGVSTGEEGLLKIVNCHNYGKLVKKGAGGCRLGGIHGGAATLENCVNEGEIVVEGISTAGAVGGLVGYPTQAYHPVTNCKNIGNITVTCDVAFAVGGLFGQGGNTNQNYSGCSVKTVISAPASVNAGLILGTAKTLAAGKSIVYGTAEAPIKVMGTVKGVAATADNYKTLLIGDGGVTAAETAVIDTTNVQYGE